MTVPADALIDSPTRATARATASCGRQAGSEALSDPEHEEQPVVGPGPEDEHDQEQLGDLGDLEPVGAELADERARQLQDERRGQQGDQRRQQRAEDEQQQHDDEQDRQQLGLVAGRARLLLLRDVGGDGTGQVELDARGRSNLRERGRQPVDHVRRGPRAVAGDVRLDEELHRTAILRCADVLHGLDVRDLLGSNAEAGERLGVCGADRAMLADADDDDRYERRLADQWLSEIACERARRAGRQERRVVVVDLASPAMAGSEPTRLSR